MGGASGILPSKHFNPELGQEETPARPQLRVYSLTTTQPAQAVAHWAARKRSSSVLNNSPAKTDDTLPGRPSARHTMGPATTKHRYLYISCGQQCWRAHQPGICVRSAHQSRTQVCGGGGKGGGWGGLSLRHPLPCPDPAGAHPLHTCIAAKRGAIAGGLSRHC